MSKFVILLLMASQAFLYVAARPEEKKYTTKYDNVDVDAIIKSDRLMNSYVGCLLETNACTPEGTELKKNLPDGLATGCSACSEAQKMMSDKICHHLIDNKPNQWMLLEKKYDPSGDYRKLYLGIESEEEKKDNGGKD